MVDGTSGVSDGVGVCKGVRETGSVGVLFSAKGVRVWVIVPVTGGRMAEEVAIAVGVLEAVKMTVNFGTTVGVLVTDGAGELVAVKNSVAKASRVSWRSRGTAVSV